MKRYAVCVVAVIIMLVGAGQLASANTIQGMELTVIINNQLVSDTFCSGWCGSGISYVGSYGGMNLNIHGTSNLPGDAASNTASTFVSSFSVANTGATGTVEFFLWTYGFTNPQGYNLDLGLFGSASSNGREYNYALTGGASAINNGDLAVSSGVCLIVADGTCSSGASSAFAPNGGPFSLTSDTVIWLTSGAVVTGGTQIAAYPAPEPASMVLFGSGLIGLAGVIRRKLGK